MSAALPTLRLYRRLLRVGNHWPHEANRPGRNLRDSLLKRTRIEFRENKNVDEQKAKALIEQGKRELKHLQDMMNNKAFDEFPIREIHFPIQAKKSKDLLSTEQQTKQERKKEGIMQRISNSIFGKKVKT